MLQADCKKLRRNDPNCTKITEYPDGPYPSGYGRILGQALVGNTHVSRLELSLNEILTDEEDENEDLAQLLQYIRTSPALRVVKLDGTEFEWVREDRNQLDIVGLFLNAMADNPSIDTFDGICEIPAAQFCHFMSQTTTLKTLVLLNYNENTLTVAEQAKVAKAIRDARSLESICLLYDDTTTSVLLQMKESRSELRTLKLTEHFDILSNAVAFWDALSQFLGSANSLELLLLDVYLKDETVELCLAVLRQFARSTSKQTPRVVLEVCRMDDGAIDSLVHFVRETATTRSSNTDLGNTGLRLSLELSGCWRKHGSALIQMMQLPTTNQELSHTTSYELGGTASSVLHTLSLVPSSVDNFFDLLTSNAHCLFLHTLKLTYLNELSCFELAESLPSWLSIRELTLASIPKGQPRFDPSERRYRNCRSDLWDSFRKNSSLYIVTITDTNGLHKGHLIRIKAYCQRNRFFDEQWSDSKWFTSDKGELVPNPPNTVNRIGPALLGSAQQVPKTNVSRLLGYLSKAETKLT